MSRVRRRSPRYPQPNLWPGGRATPFLVVIATIVLLATGLAVAVGSMITWPDQEELVETPIYSHPVPELVPSVAPPTAAEEPARSSNESDWAIGWDMGRFFTQTNGHPEGPSRQGFGITDEDDVEFWQAYKDLGGRRVLGFPLSRRFIYQGRVTQVLQKAVFQWDPASKSVAFVNVLDDVRAALRDDWLIQEYGVPPTLPPDFDRGKVWGEVVRSRLDLLAADGIILGAYYAVPDPLTLYGLPTSRVEDRGKYNAVQFQRAIIKHWKIDADDPRAGQVVIIGSGEIGAQSGIFPAEAFVPEDPPPDLTRASLGARIAPE